MQLSYEHLRMLHLLPTLTKTNRNPNHRGYALFGCKYTIRPGQTPGPAFFAEQLAVQVAFPGP